MCSERARPADKGNCHGRNKKADTKLVVGFLLCSYECLQAIPPYIFIFIGTSILRTGTSNSFLLPSLNTRVRDTLVSGTKS